MKIAILHYSAPPLVGGVERVVEEQIQIFRTEGHHVTLACLEGGQETRAHCFIPLSKETLRHDFITYLSAALSGVDVVIFHNIGTMPFSIELTAALRSLASTVHSARWICWVHDLAAANPEYAALQSSDAMAIIASKCPDWEYVAVSEDRAQQVRHLLRVPCIAIPNGICLSDTLNLCPQVADLAESAGWWDADLVLFHPTRIVRRKAIETGVRITAELIRLGWNANYVVSGQTDPHRTDSALYREELNTVIQDEKVESAVWFLADKLSIGALQLASLYSVSDALLFPSLQEGFGLPILEAGAFRIPAFCPNRSPLNALPGVITWNPDWAPREIAAWLVRQIEARGAIHARKTLVRNYRWKSIYRNFLAPLLQQPQTLNR